MAGVLISYRREDASSAVHRLRTGLEQRFADTDLLVDLSDVGPGDDFADLQTVLDGCDVVLAVIGPRWIDAKDEEGVQRIRRIDDHVRVELLAAHERDIPIIPVLVEEAAPPSSSELPEALEFLAYRPAVTVGDVNMRADIERLAVAIEAKLVERPGTRARSSDAGESAVTFLFTDIEDSSSKWEQHTEGMRDALARHDQILRSVAAAHGGEIFAEAGDGMAVAFDSPIAAIRVAAEVQRELHGESWDAVGDLQVRMAINTGTPQKRAGNYFGPALNRTSRLLELANGGQILVSNATEELVSDDLPSGAALVDRGTHHLRSLHRPEHVFQLRHPDLQFVDRALRVGALPAAELPLARDTFIGRDQELAKVLELLQKSRLVTLTGAGGTGKTRLSMEVARTLVDDYPDGVHVARLEPIEEDGLVVKAIAEALDVEERPGEDVLDLIVSALREGSALLTVDNCEHVIEAAAAVVSAIHASCPGVTILATSREPLGLPGEVNFTLPGLAVPVDHDLPASVLAGIESVALFVDRAKLANSAFRLTDESARYVARLCDYVDGIPLAIELAAAGASVLTPREILEEVEHDLEVLASRSRTVVPRHKTLEAAIAWSYRLLSSSEQRTFERLSVFRGGFTREAATAVAGDDEGANVFADLFELVAKSLVIAEEGGDGRARYRMLTTLRQFGAERLQNAGRWGHYAARHADFFLALAERMAEGLHGPDQQHARDQLEMERDNLAAAVDWAVATGRREIAGRLAVALRWFWYWGGHILEGQLKLDRVLEALKSDRDALLGTVAMAAGILADVRGALGEAQTYLDLALAVAREVGDTTLEARTEAALGVVARDRGDLDEADVHFRRSIDLSQDIRHDVDYEITVRFASEIAYLRGDEARAERLLEEALDLSTQIGRTGEIAWTSTHVGEFLRRRGRLEDARSRLEDAARLHRQLDYPRGIAWTEMFLGAVERDAGHAEVAETRMRRALGMFDQVADQRGTPYTLIHLAALARERDELESAASLAGSARAAASDVGDRRAVALSDIEAAAIAWAAGHLDAAALAGTIRELSDIGDVAGMRSALRLAAEFLASEGDQNGADRFAAAADGEVEELVDALEPAAAVLTVPR